MNRLRDFFGAAFHRGRRQTAPRITIALPDGVETCSQLGQDLWVLRMTGARPGGIFVEIGSSDGVDINNTYLLETRFGWGGVCVEPNPAYYEQLARQRSARTFRRAVFPETGLRMEFIPDAELGTLKGFESSDFHAPRRTAFMAGTPCIEVETISPDDLFRQCALPQWIDYLSLDTEGSEWEIIEAIDHATYRFGLITIEHNFVEDRRGMIYARLKALGYYRLSVKFDDWYWHPVYLDRLNAGIRVDFDAVVESYRSGEGHGSEPA